MFSSYVYWWTERRDIPCRRLVETKIRVEQWCTRSCLFLWMPGFLPSLSPSPQCPTQLFPSSATSFPASHSLIDILILFLCSSVSSSMPWCHSYLCPSALPPARPRYFYLISINTSLILTCTPSVICIRFLLRLCTSSQSRTRSCSRCQLISVIRRHILTLEKHEMQIFLQIQAAT